MIKRFLLTLIVSFFATIAFCLLEIPYTNRLPPILFTVCGILFSVGMSQLMTYDLKEVVNEEVFDELTKSIKFFQKSFVYQFYYSGAAFLLLEVINEKKECNMSIIVRGKEYSAEIFLSVVLIYGIGYFLDGYKRISDKKMKLDDIIRKERKED